MFEKWKEERNDKKRARQLKRCEQGKHVWFLLSEATMARNSNASGGNTQAVYKCSYCGKERTETFNEGQKRRKPMSSIEHNSL